MILRPPCSTLFPYTTLFRSVVLEAVQHIVALIGHHSQHGVAHDARSEEHTSELQSRFELVCRLLLEKKNRLRDRAGHEGPMALPVEREAVVGNEVVLLAEPS